MPFQSTPRVNGATITALAGFVINTFQSTPRVNGATLDRGLNMRGYCISIHAPRERGDFDPL